jgi:predicted secreted protein
MVIIWYNTTILINTYNIKYMKKILLGLFMLSFFVIGSKASAATLDLTSINNGTTFQISQGQTLRVTLSNPADGGYLLDNPIYDSSILQLTNHQHINPIVTYPMTVGNSGNDYWEFQALNSGNTQLKITATRQWVGGDTVNLFSSTIIVNSSYNNDYGCANGQVYSSTTGQYCNRNNTTNPTISGVSGPQSLNLNQTGTWTVNASNPNGGNLTYSVDWGDIVYGATTSYQIPQYQQSQTATFTHSYSRMGTYTPTFTVTSDNSIRCFTTPCPTNSGSARTSISVTVSNTGNDYGCSLGQIYSNTTGLRCPVIVPNQDYGCSQGQIFSIVTGLRCGVITNIDSGCSSGNIYSYTTGQRCQVVTPYLDSGCSSGNIYNYTTGQRCTDVVTTDVGCSAGNIYSYTTGQLCSNTTITVRRTLRRGMMGDEVRRLQQFLGITADGVYGSGTYSYVRNWQMQNGLNPDGTFGPKCYQIANFIQ